MTKQFIVHNERFIYTWPIKDYLYDLWKYRYTIETAYLKMPHIQTRLIRIIGWRTTRRIEWPVISLPLRQFSVKVRERPRIYSYYMTFVCLFYVWIRDTKNVSNAGTF